MCVFRIQYIGTTSLDAELALLMANLARVRPHDLVYDPFCGTAGTLVAAAAFGARVVGCDLHLPALRGELRTRSGPSKLLQSDVMGIPETFAAYGFAPVVDRLHGDSGAHLNFLRTHTSGAGLFDAIITDPPYGIREKPAEVADERFIGRTLPQDMMDNHVPRRALAALDQILGDIFRLAVSNLVPGGRLVFLLPTTEPFSPSLLPAHDGLIFEGACEQLMAARWSRWVVVMRRAQGAAAVPPPSALVYHQDGTVVDTACGSASAGEAPAFFNRSSLRPDDANGPSGNMQVLHPQLLGKSAGARRRLERRTAPGKEATQGGGAVDSSRRQRRQARNTGRGAYEEHVRLQLGAAGDISRPQTLANGLKKLCARAWQQHPGVLALVATLSTVFVAARHMRR